VEEFTATAVVGGMLLRWKPCANRNYRETELLVGTTADVADALPIWRGAASEFTWTEAIDGHNQIWARHYNSSDKVSAIPATVAIDFVAVRSVSLQLQASSQIFAISKAGDPAPASITFTAVNYHLLPEVVFTVVAGTATLAGSGATRTLAFADMESDSVTVRVADAVSSDLVTVVKLREGIDGVAGVRALLSNEVHVLAADASGAVASYDSAWSTIKVYLGLVDDTANWTLAATASAGVDSALSYPGGVARVSVSAMSVDSGYVEISATRAGYTTPPPFRFNVVKVRAGSNGTNGTPGAPGANGQTSYLHIKWSNDGGSTFTAGSGETPGAYMGTCTDFNLADPATVGAYTWALVKGADGTNGTPGLPGANGQTSYLHIKYSNDGGSTFTASGGEAVGAYIGTCTDFNLADPTTVGAYTWALIKGADGTNGIPGAPGTNSYLHVKWSDDGGSTFTAASGETPGKYIGTCTDSNVADPTTVGAYTWALVKGADGAAAVTATLDRASHVFTADFSGTITSWMYESRFAITVAVGGTPQSYLWSFSVSPSSGVTVTDDGVDTRKFYYVSGMTAETGYVDVTCTRAGYPSQTVRFGVSKVRSAGATGALSCSIPLGNLASSGGSGTRVYGSRSVSVSGGKSPYSYSWAISSLSSDTGTGQIYLTGGTTGSSVGISGKATNDTVIAVLSCTVTDADGRSTAASVLVTGVHGAV
jgi:hypothetical protein